MKLKRKFRTFLIKTLRNHFTEARLDPAGGEEPLQNSSGLVFRARMITLLVMCRMAQQRPELQGWQRVML